MISQTLELRYLIKLAERIGMNSLNDHLAQFDVTGNQSEVLQVLYQFEPLSLREIGELIICEKKLP